MYSGKDHRVLYKFVRVLRMLLSDLGCIKDNDSVRQLYYVSVNKDTNLELILEKLQSRVDAL